MRSILKRVLALSLLALVAPYRAGALGLGDIKLHSYLNQPLNASINVLPVQKGELNQVHIGLAPKQAFEDAGIERAPVLDQIQFKLVKGKDGKPRIQLTSQNPIKEPFLDFVLQITWPKGSLSREYTVLLDPPITTTEHAPPIQPAAAVTAQQASPAGQTTTAAPAVVPVQAQRQAPIATRSIDAKLTKDSYGPTQRDNTLWSIAKAVRPDDSVSVQQVMLALVKKNPQAFYHNNVNMLKAGYVLRLPNKALITRVTDADAIREVERQYHQWRQIKQGTLLADDAGAKTPGARVPSAPTAPGHPSAAKSSAGSGTAGDKPPIDQGARLTLLPPDADKAGAGGIATATTPVKGKAGQGTAGLQRQLQSLQQKQQQDNDALRSQINDLNQQVASMQRLLSLKDDTLSALQQKLRTLEGGAPPSEVRPQTPAPIRAAAKPEATQVLPAKPAPAAAVRALPKRPASIATVHPSRDSGMLADPKVLGMGGVVILLLSTLTWLSVRRRRAALEALGPEIVPVPAEGAAQAEAETGTEAAAANTDGAQEQAYMPTGGDLLEAEVNEIDPLAEADVYMAYRRYQQAEELLKGAMQQEPHRQELRLKLIEVYAASGNDQAFLGEAQSLYAETGGAGSAIWSKVADMGREIMPDHPLFSERGAAPAATEVAASPAPQAAADDDLLGLFNDGGPDEAGVASLGEAEPALHPGAEVVGAAAAEADFSQDLAALEEEEQADARDNSIDFESGLDTGAHGASAADATEAQGNEIDFDLSSDTEQQAGGDEVADQGVEGAASTVAWEDGPVSAAAGDASVSASGDAAPTAEQGQPLDPASGLEGMSADGGALLAGVGESETTAAEQSAGGVTDVAGGVPTDVEQVRAHKLDFDIDFDKIAGRDRDFDKFFEELDGVEPGEGDGGAGAETALGGHDEVATKLDLAKAFIEMGDQEGARDILKEVVDRGDEEQRQEAQGLLQQLDV